MRNLARTFWVSGLGAILSLGLVQGCGDDEDDDGKGGRGGTGGGTSGSGGKAGSAGTGGSSGSAGTGGNAGTGGGDAGRALTCDVYCDLITANCMNSDAGDAAGNFAQYDNRGDCVSTCNTAAGDAGDAGRSWRLGTYGGPGNTLGCRIYHADNAQSGEDPGFHCQHAGEFPTAICLDADAGGGDAGDASTD
jgi:hypothetical protein